MVPDESPPEPARTRAEQRRAFGWSATPEWTLAFVGALAAVEVWGICARDPDFFLPDVMTPLALVLLAVFLATGFVRHARARAWIRGFFLLTTAALLLLEARYRFQKSTITRVERSPDVLLRYRYRPGHVEELRSGEKIRVNSSGFLDVEHVIPKPAGVFRIAVLTGSIANDGSIPFDDRFFRVLGRELAEAVPGRRVEVMNVSCEGYNSVQQVRALEKVGLGYQPDVVVVAYMLTSAALQNGGYRRIGNSFFAFRFLPLFEVLRTGSMCSVFRPFHESYAFDLIVRNSFERLAMLGRLHGFQPLVAVLPVVEDADNPTCGRIYDQVVRVARETGLPALRVADAFQGLKRRDIAKLGRQDDICHPNVDGHHRIGKAIADGVRGLLASHDPPDSSGYH